jgi:NADPH-dependent curcumin reductase CurA
MGARVIVAAGSDEKVALALSRAGPDAKGFTYDGCDGKEFRMKLKEAAGKGTFHLCLINCFDSTPSKTHGGFMMEQKALT